VQPFWSVPLAELLASIGAGAGGLSHAEAVLTGESWLANEQVGVFLVDMPLAGRLNRLHLGTHMVSGRGWPYRRSVNG
jgi:hypothetical protein